MSTAKTKARFRRRVTRERKKCGHYKIGSGSLPWRLKALGHKTYASYLASEHWQTIRAAHIIEYGDLCAAQCGKEGAHMHHRTYERLGAEFLSDLVFLCADCHHNVHQREWTAIKGGIEKALHRLINKNLKAKGIRPPKPRKGQKT